MSKHIAFVLVLAACGSKSTPPSQTVSSGPPPKPAAFEAPAVSASSVIATDDSPPPVLVMIDAKGQRSLAAAASWSALAAGTLSAGPKLAGDEASYRHVKEGTILGKDPKAIVDEFSDYRVAAEDRDRKPTGAQDDPPPPEDEDESGGTGTAMALDEGKMGSRQQAIDQARAAGILGGKALGGRGPRWTDPRGKGDEVVRQASVVGEVSDKMKDVPAVVIPHPSTKAAIVVKAVTELEAMIGVKRGGEIRPLRIQFHRDRAAGAVAEATDWLEVRLESSGLTIEAVPSKATTVTWAETAGKLKAVLAEARDRRKLDPKTPVDVLVAPDIDAQHLVDMLVALDGAGVKSIGLGLAPTGTQLSLRGHDPAPKMQPRRLSVPTVSIGQPNARGDLDKAIIHRYIKRNIQKIQYCYEKELLATPGLQGTVQVQFFIMPDGNVKDSTASGVSTAVASCVAAVIKAIEFPKPKTGGGVQVHYPFTFRPGSK